MCTPRPAQPPSAGAFPADAPEALPIYGPILLSDASAVSGQIPGIPSPSSAGQGRGAGKGAGIFPGRRLSWRGKPQARVQGARGGKATLSWAQGATRAALTQQAGAGVPPRPRPLRQI